MLHFRLPHNPMVFILFTDLNGLVHKDIWHPHSSSGTSTSSCSITVESTKFTEHFAIQLALVVCYIPHTIVVIVFAKANKRTFSSHLRLIRGIGATLVYFNLTLNPFFYCSKINEVRQAVKLTIRQTLCCPWS